MAKVDYLNLDLDKVHGRVSRKNKRSGMYFCTRYGEQIAVKAEWQLQEPTAAQLAVRARFAEATQQANADMADPEKRAEWQEIADASNGKWKTARGAAFASYYAKGNDFD
jgi:hypothetical protein